MTELLRMLLPMLVVGALVICVGCQICFGSELESWIDEEAKKSTSGSRASHSTGKGAFTTKERSNAGGTKGNVS